MRAECQNNHHCSSLSIFESYQNFYFPRLKIDESNGIRTHNYFWGAKHSTIYIWCFKNTVKNDTLKIQEQMTALSGPF